MWYVFCEATEEAEVLHPLRPYTAGPFVINERTGVVARGGRSVRLTPLQLNVFVYLAKRLNTLVRKEELYISVWGAHAPPPKNRH